MASLSKEEKNNLKKAWKASQSKDYILAEEDVQDLFEYLEEQLENFDCDHTLRYTEQWLKDNTDNKQMEAIIEEITDMGGYCDCEVLLNCYEDYDIG